MLGEGSLYERLRRDPAVRFDPEMAHATLVYDDASRAVLERTHREYLDIGQAHGVPMLTATDTWRANRERQDRSPFRDAPGERGQRAVPAGGCARATAPARRRS